ncbi:MAG: HNH endonuclease [Burkholderiaceae bacterium]|nr:HNH endonuclease [Burkholderiaceae bacterium]MCD8516542.1 HNH endonuclease [Burkholderiaceae bacterium]
MPDTLPVCPLCERPVPASEADAHHLVPKSRGGTRTVVLHRICHRQVHALFTEVELERQYPTIESLRAHPELARFLAWVKGKPDDFFERTRKSKRLKTAR